MYNKKVESHNGSFYEHTRDSKTMAYYEDPCKQPCGSRSGIGAFLTPGSGMGKKSGSGSGMTNNFWVKKLNSLMRIRIRDLLDPGSWIRDPGLKNSDQG